MSFVTAQPRQLASAADGVSGASRCLQVGCGFRAKGDDRKVFRGRILFETRDGRTDIAAR